jgi:putative FmdB family regulatory protein
MPIYEYRCEHGHIFEVMQRMSDDPVASCETCAAPVARVFTPIAVHFKGSGFYSTDYGSKKRSRELKEAAEGADKPSKDGTSTSPSSSDGKSDSAPAKSDGGAAKSDGPTSTPTKAGSKSSSSSASSD